MNATTPRHPDDFLIEQPEGTEKAQIETLGFIHVRKFCEKF
jgi:hypothetical protein